MIHNHTHPDGGATRGNPNLKRWATYASCSVATILIISKLGAYLMTDSVAMLSSLLDSTVDLLASLVTMYGVASALKPPDQEHRYGHGKAEPLAALGQATFITGSALLLCVQAIERLHKPEAVQNTTIGYGVMIFSIIMTVGLLEFQRAVVKRTLSVAISTDRLHYAGDVLINIAVMISLYLQTRTGQTWIDPLFALLIGAVLLVNAWRIGLRAMDVLMDHELPESDRQKIETIIRHVPQVLGFHDLRTRSDSERIFIDVHIEVDPQMPLRKAHDVADRASSAVSASFAGCDVLVHLDPAGIDEPRLDTTIENNKD